MKYLLFTLIFFSANTIACWEKLFIPETPIIFLLAMGAETGELTKANSDAQSFANAVQKYFKINDDNVCVIPNVKKLGIKKALKTLQKLARSRDKVFIYFSGHGTTLPDYHKEEDDCLDEAFITNSGTLRDDKFVKLVNDIKTKNIVTFLDSCFASGMLRGEKECSTGAKSKFKLSFKAKKLPNRTCPKSELTGKSKRLNGILYAATRNGQLAWEYPQGGIFTRVFIEKLETHNTFDEAFIKTKQQVLKTTKATSCEQEPKKW
ncbi:MAG: caspase family protein [Candidatus Marithrix sp.]|nr:caspase family protein [Candidatus Marithrix sp.]